MGQESVRVLFICHGNICRSAMAQCVMQDLVDKAGLHDSFVIDSAATTNEEMGMPIYPPARKKLEEVGIEVVPHLARRVLAGEEAGWDYIAVMDDENLRHLRRIWGPENLGRVCKLMAYVGDERNVADPWYTRDFDACFDDVSAGCEAMLSAIREEREL